MQLEYLEFDQRWSQLSHLVPHRIRRAGAHEERQYDVQDLASVEYVLEKLKDKPDALATFISERENFVHEVTQVRF